MNYSKKDCERKKRQCFRCGKDLNFSEFYKNKELPFTMLKAYWMDDRLQFFCCSCYFAVDWLKHDKELRLIIRKKRN